MFHTHILASSGTVVDFDRASFLMSKDILQQSLDAMAREQRECPRYDAIYDAQWVWDYYCERHRERFGPDFAPDVIAGWDNPQASQPTEPLPQPPP